MKKIWIKLKKNGFVTSLFALCRQEKSDGRCYSGVCEVDVKLQSAAGCRSLAKRLETGKPKANLASKCDKIKIQPCLTGNTKFWRYL